MEPGGLAIGLLRLGSLFGSSLEAIERFETWRDFGRDSRTLAARFEADRLRLERWGQAVGFENGRLSERHHEALDDARTASAVEEIFFVIKDTCGSEGDGLSVEKSMLERPHRRSTSDSKLKKLKWAMGDKVKRLAQVEQFRVLVQGLYNLIPLDGSSSSRSESTNGNSSDREPWNSECRSILNRIESEIEVETRKNVHGWLMGHHETNDLYETSLRRKLHGTCGWILDRPAFTDWASEHFPSGCAKVLWINGSAGFGKTILCASLVEHISSQLETPVGYFFFSSDFESRGDPYVAVRCWLSQVIASHPAAFDIVYERWVNQSEKSISRGGLVRVLQDVTRALPGCTFILDGLDECVGRGDGKGDGQHHDGDSIKEFVELLTHAIAQTNTRILVVSRDEPEIRRGLSGDFLGTVFYQNILPQDVQSDILSYSRSIVDKKLVKKTESLKQTISQRMADRCNGQFLWLRMQEDNLRGWKNQKQLEDTIDQTPTKLGQIYERNWDKIMQLSERERNRAISLLRWAAFALRPLTVCEIAEALLMSDSCEELLLDEMPDEMDQEYVDCEILSLCGSLVEIRDAASKSDIGLRTVHLAHFSVKEFFISKTAPTQSSLMANEQLHSSVLANMCLGYVNCLTVWQADQDDANQVAGSLRVYAATSWDGHIALAKADDSMFSHLIKKLLNEESENWKPWRTCFDQNRRDGSPDGKPLYYAALLGLVDIVNFLVKEKHQNVNEATRHGETPLAVACEKGNIDIVEALLEAGANIATIDVNGWAPINLVSFCGHLDIAKLLIEKGADLTLGCEGWTPLHCACQGGHIEVAKLLLDSGANIEDHNQIGWTPLNLACDNGHIEMVKLLLERGAGINAPNTYGSTPIYRASSNGQIAVVKLLLEKGADVTIAKADGWTPLMVASYDGYPEIVKLFLDNGVNVETANNDGLTSLGIAAQEGELEVVRLLLERGANLSLPNHDGWTALNVAASQGYYDVVKLLLDHGADHSTPNKEASTPLISAANSGYLEVVELLIESGADINHANNEGWTGLHTACSNGFVDIADHLLDRGADMTVRTLDGSTPLIVAAECEESEMVKFLVSKGADTEAENDYGWKPIHSASYSGRADVVKLLLDHGTDVDDEDINYRSALFHAAARGHIDVVRVLIEHGANFNATDFYDSMPIFASTRNGKDEVTEFLLSVNNIPLDFRDGFGKTLFWWASRSGSSRAIDLLLQEAGLMGIQVNEEDLRQVKPRPKSSENPTWWCDVCTRHPPRGSGYYECDACHGDGFFICGECYEMGMRCHEASHELDCYEVGST